MTQRFIWNPLHSASTHHLFDEATGTLTHTWDLPDDPRTSLAPQVELRDDARMASLISTTIPCLKATAAPGVNDPRIYCTRVAWDELHGIHYLRLFAFPFGERAAFVQARPHHLTSALAVLAHLPLVRVRLLTASAAREEISDEEWQGDLAIGVIGVSYADARDNLAIMARDALRPFFPFGLRVIPL